jgi:hypothetical protein
MVSALRVFRNGLVPLFPRFFASPAITILNSLLLERLKELTTQQLRQTIDDLNLVDRVIQAWPDSIANGNLTCLAIYLNSKTAVHPKLQSAEWKAFVDESLSPRMSDRMLESFKAEPAPELGFGGTGKKGLVPTASYGGLGSGIKSISGLMSFSAEHQAKVEEQFRAQQAAKPTIPTTGSFSGTSLLLGAGPKKGVGHMGASFTIPTLYQAEPPNTALIC